MQVKEKHNKKPGGRGKNEKVAPAQGGPGKNVKGEKAREVRVVCKGGRKHTTSKQKQGEKSEKDTGK